MPEKPSALDLRFMAAAIRLAERNVGLTGTNPSVGSLIVRDGEEGPVIVGRGITAVGGRPHAEPVALAEAGERAVGATAYVSLEPCAHHGRTPPCAEALIRARIGRVVFAASDPDRRVDGRGAAMLREAGIAVMSGVMAERARRSLGGYLARVTRKRPQITMKIALSSDGMIGREGGGQIAITGPIANAQTHLLRAQADVVLVGVGTVREDDPLLTCRIAGLGDRSPLRIILDGSLETPTGARLVRTARETPCAFATLDTASARAIALHDAGCDLIACEAEPGSRRIALPELLEDLAARGISKVLVEAGAAVGTSLLQEDLVDRLIVVQGSQPIGSGAVRAPVALAQALDRFHLIRQSAFAADLWREYERNS